MSEKVSKGMPITKTTAINTLKDYATLSRSEGQKKRRKEVEELRRRESAVGGSGQTTRVKIPSLQAALEQQGQKLDAFIASTDARLKNIEEHAKRNTTIL
ncbi:hypothetical protein Acr_17g0008710 [Actinidia rufa]|uniref:Uncharacterized protein n=1 Tax=Actinidia rufa TaxID=165716 RepID=A0A7J0G3F2_9ERIC|nr:hypothetical protein Acr_17g0008710 [Actinidia rufa]